MKLKIKKASHADITIDELVYFLQSVRELHGNINVDMRFGECISKADLVEEYNQLILRFE